jgi:hypothetical protein
MALYTQRHYFAMAQKISDESWTNPVHTEYLTHLMIRIFSSDNSGFKEHLFRKECLRRSATDPAREGT